MKTNMGAVDRLVRIVLAVVVIVLYATGRISGYLSVILGIVAVAFLVTSAIGYCPAYVPLKLSTKRKR
ncbi:MAG: rane protein [Acidobacteria bacterium]|nr:rane protein [Acidobacteriota bacterium]